MPLVSNRRQLLAKIEATKGTAETLGGSEATILCENPRYKLNVAEVPRNLTRASISTIQSCTGPQFAEITFRTPLKGSGVVGTAPAIGTLLQGCGFAETLATAGVTYALVSGDADSETLTLGVNVDGYLFIMDGARGNVMFTLSADGCWCDWTFRGKFESAADTALEGTVTYESTTCLHAWGNACTIDFNLATAAWTTSVWSALTLDLNNNVVVRTNMASADATGLAYAMITGRDPGGSVDFQAELVATQDLLLAYRTPLLGTLSMQVGSTDGNECTFNFAGMQIVAVDDGDRDGVATMNCTYKLRSQDLDAGDDELSLVFT